MKRTKHSNFLISVLLIAIMIIQLILPVSVAQAASHTHTVACYENASLHTCTGSASAGGGCYGTPVYHIHSSSCPTHSHIGSSTSGGECYGTPVYHTHTDACNGITYPNIISISTNTYLACSITVKVNGVLSNGTSTTVGLSYSYSNYSFGLMRNTDMGSYTDNEDVTIESSYYDIYNSGSISIGTDIEDYAYAISLAVPLAEQISYMKENHPNLYLTILTDLSNLCTEFTLSSGTFTASDLVTCYTCGKTTSTVESYSLNCGIAAGEYTCGKTTSTIDSYQKSCGKENGKYYTASGEAVSPMCDTVVTKIAPNSISTQYRKNHGQATAVATYLDGHTATVNVTTNYDPSAAIVGSKEYTATYTGRITSASTGTGNLTASITIETVGASSFVLEDDSQLVAKGNTPNYKGTVTYGSLGSFVTDEHITSNFDSTKVGVQTVTVTYDGGNKVTDTMTVRIPADPISIKADNITTTKGTDKTISATVTYEDGTTTVRKFKLSDNTVTYTDTYTEGTVDSTLKLNWKNNNSSEAGKDYKTGGNYTLNLNYGGVSSSITVTVIDSCTKNANHVDFAHDTCPTCGAISDKQASFDAALSEITKLSTLAKNNAMTLTSKDFPTENEVIDRHVGQWKELSEKFNELITELKNLSTTHSNKVTSLKSEWSTASTTDEIVEVLNSAISYKTGKEDVITAKYNEAIDIYNQANELRERKTTINNFTPVITINGTLTKTYDQSAATWSADVTAADFESDDFVNPVKYYIYEDSQWVLLEKELVDAGTYTLKAVTTDTDYLVGEKQFTVTINPKVLTATYTGQNKVYDGDNSVTLTLTLKGVLTGDTVTVDKIPATYAKETVGTEIVITPNNTIILKGTDASNYKLEDTVFKGNITQKELSLTYSGQNKVYDGNTTANLTFKLDGIVTGDIVTTTSGVGTYDSEKVGTGRVITLDKALTLTGIDAENYSITIPVFKGNITKKPLTLTYENQDKVYDGNNEAVIVFTLDGIVDGDIVSTNYGVSTYDTTSVSLNIGDGAYSQSTVGNDIVIALNDEITLTGEDADNYSLITPEIKGSILEKQLNVTYSNQNKTYDGTNKAELVFTLTGIVGTDEVGTTSGKGIYSQSNVGTDLQITLDTPFALTGKDADNYKYDIPDFKGSISPKSLNLSYSNQNKIYDGTNEAELVFTLTGIVGTDKVGTTSGKGIYSQSNVGTDLQITLDTPFALTGEDAVNYVYDIPEFKGSISPKSLNLSYSNQNKVYDGTVDVTLNFYLDGMIDGDKVKASSGKGVYATKNAGNDIAITLQESFSLLGEDANNYTVIIPKLKGNIMQKPLTITTETYEAIYGEIPDISLVYDGFVEGETEEVLKGCADIWWEIPVTKAGSQTIYVKCKISNPINYDIQPVNSTITFTVPNGFVPITTPLPITSPAIVVVDGVEKILEEPFEIWHPTDRDIIVSSGGNDWNISGDGKVSFIVDNKDVIITDDFIIVDGEEIPNTTGSVIMTGTGNLSVNDYNGEIILKDFETNSDVTISDNSNSIITVESNNKINGSVIVDSTSSIIIQGNGILDVSGGIGGTEEKPSGDIFIKNEVEVNADYIGNHPDYIEGEEDKKPNIDIDSNNSVAIGNSTVVFCPQPVIQSNGSVIIVSGSSISIDGMMIPNENDVTISGTGSLTVNNYNGILTLDGFDAKEDIVITESMPNIIVVGDNHVTGSVVVGTGASITMNGTNFDTFDVSEGIGGTEVVSSGAISFHGATINAGYIGNHENYVSTGGAIIADITVYDSSIFTDKTTVTWEMDQNDVRYPVIDTVEDVIVDGNKVYVGDLTIILPNDKVVIIGSGNLTIKDYQGEMVFKDSAINGNIYVFDDSDVDITLEGDNIINGSLSIEEDSKVTIGGTGSLIVDSVSGTLTDEDGNMLRKIEIVLPNDVSGKIVYTRDENKEGTWYTAEQKNGMASLLVNQSADKIYITIGEDSYYIDLTKEPYTLVSTKPSVSDGESSDSEEDNETSDDENNESSDKEENNGTSDNENSESTDNKEDSDSSNDEKNESSDNEGGSGTSSNGNSSSNSSSNNEETGNNNNDESLITKVSEIQSTLISDSKSDNTGIFQSGNITYITVDTLIAKAPYIISFDMKEWESELPTGDCGQYSHYGWWIKNTETNQIYRVSLSNVIIDYEEPTATLKSSVSKIKVSEKAKVTYTYYTNKKIKFKLYDLDFGISGKDKIEYQVVKKGKKLNESKWETLEKDYFYVKPSGYMQVFIRLTDKAGNQTILKTTGFKSDKTAPKIKQTGWIIQGVDTNSGIKKVVVNGKKVKSKYRFTKPGTYTVTVYDKAGNKTTKKIKITKDKTKPVIQFKDNKVTVTDNQSGIKKVTINGKKVSSTKTLKKKGTYKIVAYDKTGNKAVKKVTIK